MAIKTAGRIAMPVPKAAGLDRVASTAGDRQACRPAAAVPTQVRGSIEDAAATAVTLNLKSRGLAVYAAQMPLTVYDYLNKEG